MAKTEWLAGISFTADFAQISRRAKEMERFIAAGMDGYLSKPIRSQELDDVLAKYSAAHADSAPEQLSPAAGTTPR